MSRSYGFPVTKVNRLISSVRRYSKAVQKAELIKANQNIQKETAPQYELAGVYYNDKTFTAKINISEKSSTGQLNGM